MKNQEVRDILADVSAQIMRIAGRQQGDFTLKARENDLALLSMDAKIVHSFPRPLKAGVILNTLGRLSAKLASDALPEAIEIGPYLFHPRKSCLIASEETIVLTDKERDILAALWRAPDKSLDRENLLKQVWAYAEGVETHTLETHIYRLRRKMEADPAHPRWLRNQDGFYTLYVR